MTEPIKYIEIKTPEPFLLKRKETLNQYGALGPADACMLYFCKQASFLSKKQERTVMWFFQGLNVYPQNLSILLRDWSSKEAKLSKERLVKGVFVLYDFFEKYDAMVEINMPGSLKIFKTSDSKEILSNNCIDSMYVSSVLRTMYEKNLEWGRYYELFTGDKPIEEFKSFMEGLIKIMVQGRDIYISDYYEQGSKIRGSHSLNLVFQFVKRRKIVHHALDFYTDYIKNNTEQFWKCPKIVMLYAQLLSLQTKFYKSLKVITLQCEKYNQDPLLLFYQAKYLYLLNMYRESLKILHSIKQYNQYDIWILMAEISVSTNHITDALICLNYASKLIKNAIKPTFSYKQFETLGRPRKIDPLQELQYFPAYLWRVEEPVVLSVKEKLEDKIPHLPHSAYWKFLPQQRMIYNIIMTIRETIDKPKFELLVQATFQSASKQHAKVNFKQGISQSNLKKDLQEEESEEEEQHQDNSNQVPQFLVDREPKVEKPPLQPQRNLSIIPQIESFVENSVFEEKKKQQISQQNRCKHILYERLMKIIKATFSQTSVQFNEFIKNYNQVLPYYNKIRKTVNCTYVYKHMLDIFAQTQNYRSVIILISELLNEFEAAGVKKIDKIPYWAQEYIIDIINEKGVSHLNQLMEKLKFFDEALIDSIKKASVWKIKGSDY